MCAEGLPFSTLSVEEEGGGERVRVGGPILGCSVLKDTYTSRPAPNGYQELSIWSKDIIFLFPDGEIHGTQAWLTSYYRAGPQGA